MSTVATLSRELRIIPKSFRQLANAFTRLQPVLSKRRPPVSDNGAAPARRKPRLTAKQRAALKLQGTYLGTMRGLKPSQRARVKKIRSTKGIREAIAEARRMGQ